MKTLETLGFANIEFDGTTEHNFNGKIFTAADKISGFGSGKKTVATFTIDGIRYENIAVDRLRNILEDARTIVNYFLANAATWRGDDTRRIKAELKAMIR